MIVWVQNFANPTEVGQYAQYAYGKLKEMSFHFANKLSRLYPPSRLELEANRVPSPAPCQS